MTSLTLSNIANEIFDLRVRETCMDVMNTIIKRVELSEHRRTKDTLAFLRREVNFFFLFTSTQETLNNIYSYKKNHRVMKQQDTAQSTIRMAQAENALKIKTELMVEFRRVRREI